MHDIAPMTLSRSRLSLALLALVAWACLLSNGTANSTPAQIEDRAKIFSAESLQRMQQNIDTCAQQTGVQIHLLTYAELNDQLNSVIEQDLQKRTASQPSLLIAFGWGMEQPVMKPSVALGQMFPIYDQNALIRDAALTMADNSTPLSQRMEKAVQQLCNGFLRLTQQKHASENQPYPKQLFIALAAVVAGAAILMWTALRWLQQSSAKPEEHYFPEVEVATRLGAPYGGGSLAYTSDEQAKHQPAPSPQ